VDDKFKYPWLPANTWCVSGLQPPSDPHCGEGGYWQAYPDGSPMALGSTGAHEVWVKLMISHQGPTPLTEIPLAGKR